MLTKDPKKRADWNEVFTYEISEVGEIVDLKSKGKAYDLMSNSLKASTAASLYSNRSPVFTKENNDKQVQRVKKV